MRPAATNPTFPSGTASIEHQNILWKSEAEIIIFLKNPSLWYFYSTVEFSLSLIRHLKFWDSDQLSFHFRASTLFLFHYISSPEQSTASKEHQYALNTFSTPKKWLKNGLFIPFLSLFHRLQNRVPRVQVLLPLPYLDSGNDTIPESCFSHK